MKKFFAITLIFILPLASAQVDYEIEVAEDDVQVNSTILLTCDDGANCPVNTWNLDWNLPKNAQINNLSDSQGEINNFDRNGENLRIQSNEGPKRTSENIKINYLIPEASKQVTKNLKSYRLTMPGFPDKRTQGRATSKNLISGDVQGFDSSYRANSILFSGTGSSLLSLNKGKGFETKYYTFFGEEKNSSLPYEIAVGTTGIRQSYDRIPVALFSDKTYESKVSEWSQGEYSAGLIRLRRDLNDSFGPVLAEETVHAFNDEFLSFDSTNSAWLDEGIGSYTQSMVRKKLVGEKRTRSLFGNETSYTIRRNGSRYKVTKPSSGDREVLWSYYENDRDFMKSWNPGQSEKNIRDFGYAYSELIIRNYVSRGNSVRQLYQNINQNEKLTSNSEKWRYYSNILDLTPCKFESRKKFEECLKRVNEYQYPVYSASNMPKREDNVIEITELETPNYTQKGIEKIPVNKSNQFLSTLTDKIAVFVNSLLDSMDSL